MFELIKSKIKAKTCAWTLGRDGASAITFALALPVIIGGIVMTVEIGHWRLKKSRLQNAADMAAIAAARQMDINDNELSLYMAALGDAYENGFVIKEGRLELNSPPKSGTYAGQPGVEVILHQKTPRYFSSLFSKGNVNIKSRAVVAMGTTPGTPNCVVGLEETAINGIVVSGDGAVIMEGCAIASNTSHSTSVYMRGSGQIKASCVYAVGGIVNPEKIEVNECDAPEEGADPAADPYADITVPADILAQPCKKPITTKGSKDMYLESGHYCLANIVGSAKIQLEDGGTFVFNGIGLGMKSTSSNLVGKNVTLIFTNGGIFWGNVGGSIDLTAKTTGEYAGIVFYGDRHTSDPTEYVTISANNSARIEGAIYFPVQPVKFAGGADTTSKCTRIIARQVDFTGGAKLTNTDCSAVGVRSSGSGGGDGTMLLVE